MDQPLAEHSAAEAAAEAAGRDDAASARLVGSSAPMRDLRRDVRRAAASEAPVLLRGESGTGKELVAQLLHELSPRCDGPLVPLDCGSVSETLLESELFGHARGAFTGATCERGGLFEAASGGTLFLDEITNTSLGFQARLLRVLQERQVRRVGADRWRRVDVRIVAASNREARAEVAAGRFREDLLYRLDVIPLSLPPLRHRRSDIPQLVAHMLAAATPVVVAERAMLALLAHRWPGNVRELSNVVERALAFQDGGRIELEHLPDELVRVATGPGRSARVAQRRPPLALMLADVEGALVRERLEANAWNRTATARELGITRRCLFDKIRRYGIARGAG